MAQRVWGWGHLGGFRERAEWGTMKTMDTGMRSDQRRKVYFVVGGKHLRGNWPELVGNPKPFVPEERPERIVCGLDCWTLLTWARLCAADCPFEPVLVNRAVDGEVCVFHWDDASPRMGVHRCFAVVVQADRPAPPLADMTVVQNGLSGETASRRRIPLWKQPGLIPRDPARGTRLETVAYFGSDQYEPEFVKDGAFQDALHRRGVRFVNRFQGNWHDYGDVDAVLAIRRCPPIVLETKPASKLVNAWAAGVPAMLGPEPAYRELRSSPLDFLETPAAEAVLDAIDRLRGEPGLYAAMAENGLRRAEAFTDQRITEKWIALLTEALERNGRERLHPALRHAHCLINRQKSRIARRLLGWRD